MDESRPGRARAAGAGTAGPAGGPRPSKRVGVASGRYTAAALAAPPTGKRRFPLPVVLGAMLLGGLCALLALNTASAALEVQQRGLADTNANTTDTQQQLLRDLAAKQAPGSLASAAASLGLVPNKNPAFLRINANGSVSVLGSPVPATAPPVPPPPSKAPSASPSKSATAKPTVAKSPAPVVTVTVTRPAATPSPKPTATPSPKPTAKPTARPSASPTVRASSTPPGGH